MSDIRIPYGQSRGRGFVSLEDYCSGFILSEIEADFHSSSPVTWNSWRDEIIAKRSMNPTVNKVSDLFAAWKS